MPLTTTFTEEMVRGMAPDEATFQKAAEIAGAGRFQNLGVSSDGSWLLGEIQGSAKEPYQISADFHDSAHPVLRSTSPSRTTPDKFTLALLLSYLREPNSFTPREPGDDLLLRREKKIALDEKKKSGSAAPRRVGRVTPDKKLAAQREGLEHLEHLLVELVATGHWFEPERIEKIERTSKLITDLPACTFGLRRLQLIAKQKDLNEDEKNMLGAEALGAIWAGFKAARTLLKAVPNTTWPSELDPVVEDAIGRPWQFAELRERGYWETDVTLFELAFERIDDESRQQRLEISDLLDMSNGAVRQSIAYRPFKGLNQIPEQTSYMSPITVPEAAIHPGYVNRRIRWEKGTEQLIESPPADFLARANGLAATDFSKALEEFRGQLQSPLGPREALFFLRGERIGRVGDHAVIQDAAGVRIEMKDRRKDYSNVANFLRVAGMMGGQKPGILVRFYLQPLTNVVLGLPLAVVSPTHHLRLGV